MRMGRMILFGLACILFVVATFATWYEGSELVENTFEWENTAIITSWLHDGVVERSTISQLDYFVYALKFEPVFPIVMMLSFVYIMFALGQRFLKGKTHLSYYMAVVGIVLLVGAMQLLSSPTVGASMMMKALLAVGGILMLYATASYFKITRNVEN